MGFNGAFSARRFETFKSAYSNKLLICKFVGINILFKKKNEIIFVKLTKWSKWSSCSHNSVFLSSNDAYPYRSSCSHHPSKRKLNRGKIIKAQTTLSIMYLHILLIHCKKSCLPKLKEVFQFVWSLQALVCKKILLKLEFTEAFLSLFYKKKN